MSRVPVTILFIFVFLFVQKHCVAQKPVKQSVARKDVFFLDGKITLDSLTKYVHKVSGTRFSFNSSKVKGSKEIFFPKGTYSFTALLERIKKTTSLFYSFYKGYVIFQDNPPKQPTSPPAQKNTGPGTKTNLTAGSKNAGFITKKPAGNKKNNPVKPGPGRNNKPVNKDSAKIKTAEPKIIPGNGLQKSSDTASSLIKTPVSLPQTSGDSLKNIQTPGKDSAGNKTKASDNTPATDNKNKIRGPLNLHFGLQWNINLPMPSAQYYFTGTNGKNQPYNFLIPGIWLSKLFNEKHEVVLLFIPVQEYLTGKKTLSVITGPRSITDTTSTIKTTILYKTSGLGAGLQYNYYLNERWSIGAGFHYNWQKKALLNKQTSTRFISGTSLTDSLYSITNSSAGWQYLKSSFITGKLGAAYSFKKFQTGVNFFIPISSLTASSFHKLNGQVFLRWNIQ